MIVKLVTGAAAGLLLASSAVACDVRAQADNSLALQLAQSQTAANDDLSARERTKRTKQRVNPSAVGPRTGTSGRAGSGGGGTGPGGSAGTAGAAGNSSNTGGTAGGGAGSNAAGSTSGSGSAAGGGAGSSGAGGGASGGGNN
jgi:hypothetical protein